jgi:hypothetical protein
MVVGFTPITIFMCWDKLWVLFWPQCNFMWQSLSATCSRLSFITRNNKKLRHGSVVHTHPNNLEKKCHSYRKKIYLQKKSPITLQKQRLKSSVKWYNTFNNTEVVKKIVWNLVTGNLYVSLYTTYNNMIRFKKRAATL